MTSASWWSRLFRRDRPSQSSASAQPAPAAPAAVEPILLTPFDPEFARVMEAEARISTKYSNALRELAK